MSSLALGTLAARLRMAFCCLALLLCAMVLFPAGSAAQDAPEGELAQGAETGPSEEANPNQEAKAPPGPWDVSVPCEGVQHPFQAELCQQWRSATASERTASWAFWLMIFGFLAVLLLAWIVRLLRKANRAAASGAQSSMTTNDGAPVSALIAAREEELRAYVDVDALEFIETPESEGIVKVKISLRNSGQTPAFSFESVAEMSIQDISEEDLLPVLPLPDGTFVDLALPRLGRDAKATMIIQCDSTPKLAERVTKGDASILVWGFASYKDVFGQVRKTAFQYLCNAETLETGQIFKPMARGDEEN